MIFNTITFICDFCGKISSTTYKPLLDSKFSIDLPSGWEIFEKYIVCEDCQNSKNEGAKNVRKKTNK